MYFYNVLPDLISAPARRRAAFTLVEMIVVMGIIVLMTALVVPAFTSMRAGTDFGSAANDIGSTIEQARAYAMANNTYVYVGIGEYLVTEATSASPRTAGTGQIVLAIVATLDGTAGYDANNLASWSTNYGTGGNLTPIDKLHVYNNVHLADFSAGNATPPATGNMARPTVPEADQLGNTSLVSATPFSWPLGKALTSGQYNFTKVIQIDPQGVDRLQVATSTNTEGIAAFMEIDLQPTHGPVAPAVPANQNVGNQAALQLDCMTGATNIYRP